MCHGTPILVVARRDTVALSAAPVVPLQYLRLCLASASPGAFGELICRSVFISYYVLDASEPAWFGCSTVDNLFSTL
jgi:hypothetical protein